MSEALLIVLLRLNLAAAVSVIVVLLLRRPVRRLFGARLAYGLWSLTPLCAVAMLLPARVVTLVEPAAPRVDHVAHAAPMSAPVAGVASAMLSAPAILGLAWAVGAAAALGWLAWRQARFLHAAREGRAGPAVVGVLRPRIVTPFDFAARYTPREQEVILAHEAAHIVRQDPRINAAVALAGCVAWFNPLIHLLAHYLRVDQELACDAQVVAAFPTARRSYAEAMLKTQLAARPLPMGCYWPASSAHPLAERIALLSRRSPRRATRRLGAATVAGLALGAAWAAWAARPPEVVLAPAPMPRTPAAAIPTSLARATAVAARAPAATAPSTAAVDRDHVVPTSMATPTAPTPSDLQFADTTPADMQPATHPSDGCWDDGRPSPVVSRRLPDGFFGPPRRVHMIADWSSVEPGSAARVVATMTDPEGIPLVTDLTAFGSQSFYRLGCIRNAPSRFKLFTSVLQRGDRLLVTAGLDRSFRPMVTGSIELASGETGTIKLPNGQLITVTPLLRAETPDEIEQSRRIGRPFVNVLRIPSDA